MMNDGRDNNDNNDKRGIIMDNPKFNHAIEPICLSVGVSVDIAKKIDKLVDITFRRWCHIAEDEIYEGKAPISKLLEVAYGASTNIGLGMWEINYFMFFLGHRLGVIRSYVAQGMHPAVVLRTHFPGTFPLPPDLDNEGEE